MAQALVLNATYEPLCVVSSRRALLLASSTRPRCSTPPSGCSTPSGSTLAEPSVVRLSYYVKVPYQARIALNRRAVFARDGHRCQYCGAIGGEHRPRHPSQQGRPARLGQRGGRLPPCNTAKRDRLLEDSGMKLRRLPRSPRERAWILVASGAVRPDWEPYLGMASTATLSA